MSKNIFEQYNQQKAELRALAKQALEYGWITQEHHNEIVHKLDNEVLTIGVIGQMKAGKSTFLNAFVFERDVLPSATTPMTASLSVITYGDRERLVAEFYTPEEWQEQQMTAQRNLAEITSELERSKVQAAQELVAKADLLGSDLPSLLGKSREDSLDNLIEYVGADGRFISITKSVTIYYPKEYLKGVEIVDTPGFNDPIVSREERTKEFLSRADVVLMMLYAGRPFDATDRDIIFKNVAQCGVGKLVIGINKYDMPLGSGETEEEITEYVKEEIRKACKDCPDESLKALLLETNPLPLSAEMALLSCLPLERIQNTEHYKYAWDRHVKNFELGTQKDFRRMSLFDALSERIQEIILNEKSEILFAKPRNAIKAEMQKRQHELTLDINTTRDLIKVLSMPDNELVEKKDAILRAKKRVEKRLDGFSEELETALAKLKKESAGKVAKELAGICERCDRMVNDAGYWAMSFADRVKAQLDGVSIRVLPRIQKKFVDDFTHLQKQHAKALGRDIEELIERYIPNYNSSLLRGTLERMAHEVATIPEYTSDKVEMSLLGIATYIIGGSWELKDDCRKQINAFRDLDLAGWIDQLVSLNTSVYVPIMDEEVFAPLLANIKAIEQDIQDKEKRKEDEEDKLKDLQAQQVALEEQIKAIAL